MLTPVTIIIIGTSIASLLAGLAIGRLTVWNGLDEASKKSHSEALAALERDKKITAESLANELATIRDGILSTAEAYGRVVKVVEDKLGGSDKLYLNRGGEQKVITFDITKGSNQGIDVNNGKNIASEMNRSLLKEELPTQGHKSSLDTINDSEPSADDIAGA
jgi:hypothetical protein